MKYISLLIIGRLIIPLALCDTCLCNNRITYSATTHSITKPIGNDNDAKPFSFVHDVLEKLLPAASFLR